MFLNEPYEGSELVEKHPLVAWKEKVLSLVGYRKKKDKEEILEDLQETDTDLFESDSEDYSVQLAHENGEEEMSGLESDSIESDSEMEIEEVYNAYKVSE